MPNPNGLTFSPDYKRLYVVSTGRGPGDAHEGGKGELFAFDVAANNTVSNQKLFTDFFIDGVKARADGSAATCMATSGARRTPAAWWATAA